MNPKVILCITLDTECDKDINWETRFPFEFRSVLQGIPERLTPLFNHYGIKPTYLLSPEVLYDKACVDFLTQLKDCELGTHMHGEYIGPNADMSAPKTSSVQAEMSRKVEKEKLQNLTNLFKEKFGHSPKSFRAGRFGLSYNSLSLLSSLGYLVDSSITPFYSHQFSDRIRNNYWGAQVQPYFPSKFDYRNKGCLNTLEVPITVVNPFFLKWPRFVVRLMHNRSFIHKRLLPRLGYKIPKTTWLRPKYSSTEEMIAISDLLIQRMTKNNFTVLNMMYHPNEVIPGASPYAATEEDVNGILLTQKVFFDYLFNRYKVECATISQVRELVSKRGYSRQ